MEGHRPRVRPVLNRRPRGHRRRSLGRVPPPRSTIPDRFTERGAPPVVTLTMPQSDRHASKSPAAPSASDSWTPPAPSRPKSRTRRLRPQTSRWSRYRSTRAESRASRSGTAARSCAFRTAEPNAGLPPPAVHPTPPPAPGRLEPGRRHSDERGAGRASVPSLRVAFGPTGGPTMKAHAPSTPAPATAPPPSPAEEAQKAAIAQAVWTEIHWLMPRDRTVTVTVDGDDIAVELGSPPCSTTH